MNVSSVPLSFNIIVDETSRSLAEDIIVKQMEKFNKSIIFNFYDIDYCAKLVDDIVGVMSKFFSKPGSYYSDVLFFISLGLHRIAPKTQKRAILLDCDLYFKEDVALIFDEFKKFKSTALFGLAPELSPVYRHVLRHYRAKHNTTTFGDYYHWNKTRAPNAPHSNGFQGYNSGVVLFNLEAIRNSEEFTLLLIKESLENLTEKYDFKQGHLGDQDFYTLIGCEYPHLIQTLNCGFNRQLCEWWKNNGYRDVFHLYAHCNQKIVIVHGNCNTEIPK
ncbi:hypothetical protein HHI36_004283 [Cryptolaemus montrouzieri]|uniref:Xyloside xylosyltransferase 1 n=1 Tax=Cryptolaemus montrouzieri TaxID=559131 RepID=A0ABD2NR40_9CUCU